MTDARSGGGLSLMRAKSVFQRALRPLCAALRDRGVSPNALTIGSLAGTALACVLVVVTRGATWILCVLPAWLVARLVLDTLDGMLARETGRITALGARLNDLDDALCDPCVALSWLAIGRPHAGLVVAWALACLAIEGVRLGARGTSGLFHGPMAKPDRQVVHAALSIALAFEVPARWLDLGLGAALAMAIATLVRRARAARMS